MSEQPGYRVSGKNGKASFLSREIPVTGEIREVINEPFVFNAKEYKATCLTVGNPHCIIFMDHVSAEQAKNLGPYVENAMSSRRG